MDRDQFFGVRLLGELDRKMGIGSLNDTFGRKCSNNTEFPRVVLEETSSHQ
jgi:hypothetical protein